MIFIDVTYKDKNNPKWITHKVIVLQRPQIITSNQANLTVIKGIYFTFGKSDQCVLANSGRQFYRIMFQILWNFSV